MSAIWTFKQLRTGKELQLYGSIAPYGRPRQGPVVKELIRVNVQSTNYPGSKAPPTRHVFGSSWEPMDLHGRWMTRFITEQGVDANVMANRWTAFVRDELPLRISWGNLASYEGMITELELARESEHEIAWRMNILVDRRLDISTESPTRVYRFVSEDVSSLLDLFEVLYTPPDLPELTLSIFDYLDNIAGLLKGYTAQLVDYANLADELERQSFSTIQSFRGVLANIETALTQIQLVASNGVTDAALLVRRSESDLAWYQYILKADVAATNAIAIIRDMDRRLQTSYTRSSGASKFVTALDQDTWESISTRSTGGPDMAGAIREANGIKYGQLPSPGEIYIVP